MTTEIKVPMISSEQSRSVISAAEQKAQEIGQHMNIAIYGAGRELKAFSRMDDAWLGSIEIAIDKAFTSASFRLATQDLTGQSQPGQPLFGINTTSSGRIVVFAGGIPLERDGTIVGAIDVSGGTPEQEQKVAEAGVGAF